MSGTTDLVEFLRARLAEDQQSLEHNTHLEAEWAYEDIESGGFNPTFSGPTATRLLAEVESKRRIIARVLEGCECHWSGMYGQDWDEDILRLLAMPYADHPDYDPDWRVE